MAKSLKTCDALAIQLHETGSLRPIGTEQTIECQNKREGIEKFCKENNLPFKEYGYIYANPPYYSIKMDQHVLALTEMEYTNESNRSG